MFVDWGCVTANWRAVLRQSNVGGEDRVANISIVPSGINTLTLSIGGRTVAVDLRGAKTDDEATGGDKGDETKGGGGQTSRPVGPIIVKPYSQPLGGGSEAGVLRNLQVSIAHVTSGLEEIYRAFQSREIGAQEPRHLVIHHPANMPVDLEKIVDQSGPLKSDDEVTIFVTHEDG